MGSWRSVGRLARFRAVPSIALLALSCWPLGCGGSSVREEGQGAAGGGRGGRAAAGDTSAGTAGAGATTANGGAVGSGGTSTGGTLVSAGGTGQSGCLRAKAAPAGAAAIIAAPVCGNCALDPGEECDDGNQLGGDGCSASCHEDCDWSCYPGYGPPGACGDGLLGADESCDDGNQASEDGCSADCLVREEGFSCYFPGEPCVRLSVCGDGQLDPGEACDDGGTQAGDGCDERCLIEIFDCLKPTDCPESVCPNGKHEPGEECDEGPNGFVYGIGCMDDCRRAPYCGDGVLNGVEACDLGLEQNRTLYGVSGCSLTCTLPHRCGDARLDGLFDEQCDDGAANGTSGSNCTRECGLIPK